MARIRVEIPEEEKVGEPISERSSREARTRTKKLQDLRVSQGLIVKITIFVIVAMFILFFIVIIRDRNSLQQQLDTAKKDTPIAQDEASTLTAEIGQYFELPADETPTLATVSDVEKVKDQSFFKNTQQGDKVLLYGKSGRAILYRPSTKKIIEVATLNVSAPQP